MATLQAMRTAGARCSSAAAAARRSALHRQARSARLAGALRVDGGAAAPLTSLRAPLLRGLGGARDMASTPHPSESFLSGTNSVYMEEMYALWKEDPAKVHPSWAVFFRNVDGGAPPGAAYIAPPDLQPGVSPTAAPSTSQAAGIDVSGVSARLLHLIRAFQVRGHEAADLDPLKLSTVEQPAELDPASYGFTEADMSREFSLAGFEGIDGFLRDSRRAKLGDLLDSFRTAYCSKIGWEYMHIQDRATCNWLRQHIEVMPEPYTKEQKAQIFDRVAFSDHFERFLAQKYSAAKRFGLEGCDSLIAGIKACIDEAVNHGCEDVVMGMPHRGRLNVLSNVIRKPNELIFREFHGIHAAMMEVDSGDDWSSSGDVKYHLGTSFDRTYPNGQNVHLSLLANPSHLEAVNPVVVGKTRAKMDIKGDTSGARTMGVLLHGDAAFAGQGIVYETLHMAALAHYKTGGTIHVVCNNQIGFTTLPHQSRSSQYCSDVGKAFEIPIFHVNADSPEDVTRVFQLAAKYRATFNKDVIVDLIGYRRFGHNELDQPLFTQPKMYKKIATHPPVVELYRQSLIDEGTFTAEEVDSISARVWKTLEQAYDAAETYEEPEKWLDSRWEGFHSPTQLSAIRSTGMDEEALRAIGRALTATPEGFSVHPNLGRQLKAKAKTVEAGEDIDWATAEAMAFGSLLLEGNSVRLSGQDVERGTFSQRHLVLHDQHTWETHTPLEALAGKESPRGVPARLAICNSPLAEFSVLGFELGYSMEDPNQLVCWEAQFGDFVNGAQVIIDQFLSAGESKWLRQTGLVMLLPHGYDGQGPEHSSCRIERFLQMSDEDEDDIPPMGLEKRRQIQIANWQVCNISTPANYFHALRRQVHRDFRKPLIIASPKALLRHKAAVSSFADFGPDRRFRRVIGDDGRLISDPSEVERHLFCTGKIYYELMKAIEEHGLTNVAVTRIEQLSPFPFDAFAAEVEKYPNADVHWVQEEPQNMGYWTYVRPRMKAAMSHFLDRFEMRVGYAGRESSASPATGSAKVHAEEQQRLIDDALFGTWDNSALHSPVLYKDPYVSKHVRWYKNASGDEKKLAQKSEKYDRKARKTKSA